MRETRVVPVGRLLLLGWLFAITLVVVPASASEPVEITAVPQAESDLWIVSARRCPQCDDLCRPECLDYLQRLPDGSCIRSDLNAFLSSLDGQGAVCFLVHGNLVSWQEAVRVGTRAVNSLKPELPPDSRTTFVIFTWPSEEVVPLLFTVDLAIKAQRSDTQAYYLASLMALLPTGQPVSLVGYSHGARSVAGALELLGGGEVACRRLCNGCSPVFGGARPIRAAFVAAAIDHHWLRPGRRYGRTLCQVESLLLMNNHTDEALAFYPLRRPLSHRALGREGLSRRDWRKLGPLGAKIAEVDAAELVGTKHNWAYYARSAGVAELLAPYVSF